MMPTLLVYTVTSLVLFLLGRHCYCRENRLLATHQPALSFFSWEVLLSIAVFVLVFGLRFNTGNDYEMYMNRVVPQSSDDVYVRQDFECGFDSVNMLFYNLHIHYFAFFCFWTWVQACFLYYALNNRKYLMPWVPVLLILGMFSFGWLTFIRQWVVAMAFVAAIPLIEKRRFWPYLLFVLLASTIHRSALLLLLFYLLGGVPQAITIRRSFFFAIIALCALLSVKPFWLDVLPAIEPLLSKCGFPNYGGIIARLLAKPVVGFGLTPTFVCKLVIASVMVYFYPMIKALRPADRLYSLYFYIAFIGICYIILVNNSPVLLERPAVFTFICIIVCCAYVLDYLWHARRWLLLALFLTINVSYYGIVAVKYYLSPQLLNGDRVFYHFMHIF